MSNKMNDVVKELQEKIGDAFEVKIIDVTKNNDTIKKGISIRKRDMNIAKVFYWKNESADEIIASIKDCPYPNIEGKITLENLKDKIIFILVNANANKQRLEHMPYRMLENSDLAIIYKLVFQGDDLGMATSDIYNMSMEHLGVTEDELYKMAMENTQKLYAPSIKSMTEILCNMPKESQDIVEDIPEALFVLTNNTKLFGAGCILYPGLLRNFCNEKQIDGLFIIPSSIHETLLLIHDRNTTDITNIKQMIKDVNTENLSETEVLSDNLYYYDVVNDNISIVE